MARYQQQRNAQYPMGSVSSGTMRLEDLIPTFVAELEYRLQHGPSVPRRTRTAHNQLVRDITARMDAEGYYESEHADWDLESLFDALGEYAAPYFYFGSHPGDGADYGYWLSEGWDQDAVTPDEIAEGCEQQGDMLLRVSDLAEIPNKYRGEVLLVDGRGNMSLYVKTARTLRVVWEMV
jgi:hypothetical protein